MIKVNNSHFWLISLYYKYITDKLFTNYEKTLLCKSSCTFKRSPFTCLNEFVFKVCCTPICHMICLTKTANNNWSIFLSQVLCILLETFLTSCILQILFFTSSLYLTQNQITNFFLFISNLWEWKALVQHSDHLAEDDHDDDPQADHGDQNDHPSLWPDSVHPLLRVQPVQPSSTTADTVRHSAWSSIHGLERAQRWAEWSHAFINARNLFGYGLIP